LNSITSGKQLRNKLSL